MTWVKTHEIFARVGEYTDKDGKAKGRWLKVGMMTINENGDMRQHMDATPVSKEWDGWYHLFKYKAEDQELKDTLTNTPKTIPIIPYGEATYPRLGGVMPVYGKKAVKDNELPF